MPIGTKLAKGKVIAAIRKRKGLLYKAAADLGVVYRTIHNYALRWPEVKEAIRESKGLMKDVAESKLYEGIEAGEAWAVCFFLKCQARSRGYIERSEHRFDGKIDHNHEHRHAVLTLDNFPLELREQMLEHIERQKLLVGSKDGRDESAGDSGRSGELDDAGQAN